MAQQLTSSLFWVNVHCLDSSHFVTHRGQLQGNSVSSDCHLPPAEQQGGRTTCLQPNLKDCEASIIIFIQDCVDTDSYSFWSHPLAWLLGSTARTCLGV